MGNKFEVLKNLNICYNNLEYYATIKIIEEKLYIIPEDTEMEGSILTENHFNRTISFPDNNIYLFNFKNKKICSCDIHKKRRDLEKTGKGLIIIYTSLIIKIKKITSCGIYKKQKNLGKTGKGRQ